jgi:hypothetical protein
MPLQKESDIFFTSSCSQARSVVQEEVRHREARLPALEAVRPQLLVQTGPISPWSPDQVASRSCDAATWVTNHFGLIARATGAAGEWDAGAAVD